MKKYIIFLLFFILLTPKSYAQQKIVSPSPVSKTSRQLQTDKAQITTTLNQKIKNLQQLITDINRNTSLTSTQQTLITEKLTTIVSQLSQIKIKITTASSINALHTQTKQIQKIYTVDKPLEQQASLWKILDSFQTLQMSIKRIITPLQALEVTFQSEGKDTASFQSFIDAINGRR